MDIDRFAQYFGVRDMYLEGHTYPVKVMHAKEVQPDYLNVKLVTIFNIHRNSPLDHDVLAVPTGQEEIEAISQQIRQISKICDLIVFHDTSGRFDQIMANINTLYEKQNLNLNIYLLSGNSMTWLLRPGKHSIKIPAELVDNERWCALIPIGAPAKHVTTTGLKWNLCNSVLEFGGMVSTSNTYASEEVKIETDTCLIWSMGLFCFQDTC